jgi:hypothetical protein
MALRAYEHSIGCHKGIRAVGTLLTIPCLMLASWISAGEGWTLESLMKVVSLHNRRSLAYIETRASAFLDTPLISRGVLEVSPDGSLVKEQRRPFFQRVTINDRQIRLEGRATSIRVISLAELPNIRIFTDGLRALFNGDLETLHHRFETVLEGPRGNWRLRLTPRNAVQGQGVAQLLVRGEAGTIKQIRITETDGDSSLMEFGASTP